VSIPLARQSKLLEPKGPRQAPKKRPVEERTHDFLEIDPGFDAQMAFAEAQRCLYCPDAPCMTLGCPLHNRIPEWIQLAARGDFKEAARVSRATSNMPEVCGRLCPQERLCEGRCVLIEAGEAPVAIGKIEEFLARMARRLKWLPPVRRAAPSGKRVAIVGAGPAGLAAAEELAARGHRAVVFDRLPRPGGVMIYGIPNFKYAHERIEPLVARLAQAGVEFRCRQTLGHDFTLDDLLGPMGFHAVLLAIGASGGRPGGLPGEDLPNVLRATDFLVRANVPRAHWPDPDAADLAAGRACVVIGGGDTAMDCVRSAVRLGFQRTVCLYRRTEAEMPGNRTDRGNAKDEGVEFHFLAAPVRFLGNGRLERIACVRVHLGEPDASGRRPAASSRSRPTRRCSRWATTSRRWASARHPGRRSPWTRPWPRTAPASSPRATPSTARI
jgi:glutamate synthase (NADPH/NADH) small chain